MPRRGTQRAVAVLSASPKKRRPEDADAKDVTESSAEAGTSSSFEASPLASVENEPPCDKRKLTRLKKMAKTAESPAASAKEAESCEVVNGKDKKHPLSPNDGETAAAAANKKRTRPAAKWPAAFFNTKATVAECTSADIVLEDSSEASPSNSPPAACLGVSTGQSKSSSSDAMPASSTNEAPDPKKKLSFADMFKPKGGANFEPGRPGDKCSKKVGLAKVRGGVVQEVARLDLGKSRGYSSSTGLVHGECSNKSEPSEAEDLKENAEQPASSSTCPPKSASEIEAPPSIAAAPEENHRKDKKQKRRLSSSTQSKGQSTDASGANMCVDAEGASADCPQPADEAEEVKESSAPKKAPSRRKSLAKSSEQKAAVSSVLEDKSGPTESCATKDIELPPASVEIDPPASTEEEKACSVSKASGKQRPSKGSRLRKAHPERKNDDGSSCTVDSSSLSSPLDATRSGANCAGDEQQKEESATEVKKRMSSVKLLFASKKLSQGSRLRKLQPEKKSDGGSSCTVDTFSLSPTVVDANATGDAQQKKETSTDMKKRVPAAKLLFASKRLSPGKQAVKAFAVPSPDESDHTIASLEADVPKSSSLVEPFAVVPEEEVEAERKTVTASSKSPMARSTKKLILKSLGGRTSPKRLKRIVKKSTKKRSNRHGIFDRFFGKSEQTANQSNEEADDKAKSDLLTDDAAAGSEHDSDDVAGGKDTGSPSAGPCPADPVTPSSLGDRNQEREASPEKDVGTPRQLGKLGKRLLKPAIRPNPLSAAFARAALSHKVQEVDLEDEAAEKVEEVADVPVEETELKEVEPVPKRPRLFAMLQSNAKKQMAPDEEPNADAEATAPVAMDQDVLQEDDGVEIVDAAEDTATDGQDASKKIVSKALPPGVDSLPPGVRYEKASYTFVARRRSDGQKYTASVRKYGLQKALQLVTEYMEKDRLFLEAKERAERPSLWAARHKPQQLKWMKVKCWDDLRRWLRSWSGSPPAKRAAFIHGAVGVGKSTGARLNAERLQAPCKKQSTIKVLEYDLKDRDGRAFIDNLAKGQSNYGSFDSTVVVLEIDGVCKSFIQKELRKAVKQSPMPILLISADSSLADDENLGAVCLCLEVPRQPADQVTENLKRIAESENLTAPLESWAILAEACGGDLRRAVNSMQLFGAPSESGELLDTVATPQAACARLLALSNEAAPLSITSRSELLSVDEELLTPMVQENYLRACATESSSSTGMPPAENDDAMMVHNLNSCAAAADALAWGDVLDLQAQNCEGDVDFMNSALMMAATLPSALVSRCRAPPSDISQQPSHKLRCLAASVHEGAHPLHWTAVGELTRQYSVPRSRVCAELLRWRRTAAKSRDEAKKAPQQLASRMKRWSSALSFSSSRATERAIEAKLPGQLAGLFDAALASGDLAAAIAELAAAREVLDNRERESAAQAESEEKPSAEAAETMEVDGANEEPDMVQEKQSTGSSEEDPGKDDSTAAENPAASSVETIDHGADHVVNGGDLNCRPMEQDHSTVPVEASEVDRENGKAESDDEMKPAQPVETSAESGSDDKKPDVVEERSTIEAQAAETDAMNCEEELAHEDMAAASVESMEVDGVNDKSEPRGDTRQVEAAETMEDALGS